jgi:hypothetical protein
LSRNEPLWNVEAGGKVLIISSLLSLAALAALVALRKPSLAVGISDQVRPEVARPKTDIFASFRTNIEIAFWIVIC